MDVYVMIRRKKLTIFTDTKDNHTVHELKTMIHGILPEAPPDYQRLYMADGQILADDEKTLSDCGLTHTTTKAQSPALIKLVLKDKKGDFEDLDITPYSTPPDLPDVMKSQENNGQDPIS